MKRKLLSLFMFALVYNGFAQTTETINIDWGFNSNPSAAGNLNTDRTIEVGDTVVWTWVGGGNHNVQSDQDMGATVTETFVSGGNVPAPNSFSYVFTSIGSTEFECEPHKTFMLGTITVVAEGTLSVSSEVLNAVSMYPNPVLDNLNLSLPKKLDGGLNIEVFDVLGKSVLKETTTKLNTSISVSNLKTGIYLIKMSSTSDNISKTRRFVKM